MTQSQLARIWTGLSLALLYFALNTWIVTQGGEQIFGAKLLSSDRVPAAMIGIPICAALLAAASVVGWLYAKRSAGQWHNRVPVVGFDTINSASPEGLAYQCFWLVVFTILPAASLIHFWDVFLSAPIVLNGATVAWQHTVWNWAPTLTSPDNPARICTSLAPGSNDICIGGATVLPGLEPIIFAVLTLVAIIALALQLFQVFFHSRQPA